MKITSDRIELDSSKSIRWEEVQTLRLLNEKLAVQLKDDRVVELTNLSPGTIDHAFKAFGKYISTHTNKENEAGKKSPRKEI